MLFEVNHFFLKFVLWVPPSNPLNPIRLFMLLGVGLPGMRVRRLGLGWMRGRESLREQPGEGRASGMLLEAANVLVWSHAGGSSWHPPSPCCGPPCIPQECYEYIEASNSPQGADMLKLGAFAWLGLALALVETLVSIKFGKG